VTVLDIGAALQSIIVPTLTGRLNCILGYDDAEEYQRDPFYLGMTVGRYANRINGGRILVDGAEYQLDINEAERGNILHGGSDGFHRQRFGLEMDKGSHKLRCRHVSPSGTQGFPGEVSVDVTYELIGDSSLSIEFIATTDAATVINLANHAYFNLDTRKGRIDSHELRVCADRFTPSDATKIPSGEIDSVGNSDFDLRERAALQSKCLDHNFVPVGEAGELRAVAELYSPDSGVGLLVHTTQPGLQVYTGDYLKKPFGPRQGIALEAQNFPDAPNQPNFPSSSLLPGETYRQRTIYEFSLPKV
jgi:aldose 1-epimerase